MRVYLTGVHIANQVLMLKSRYKNCAFVIVEGRTDSFGYRWLIDNDQSKLVIAHSKSNVIECVKILENKRIEGILGIVDSDFWNLEKISIPTNILNTDTHDIETMVFKSPAIEKVLHFYGDYEKVINVGNIEQIRLLLLQAALPLGYLRWLSYKKNLNLNFKKLDLLEFINKDTLQVDISKLIRSIVANTKNCIISQENLLLLYGRCRKDISDLLQLCNGHDLVGILAIALSSVLGLFEMPASRASVSKWLLLAYEGIFFIETNLYVLIINWEKEHSKFRILNERYRHETLKKQFNQISC